MKSSLPKITVVTPSYNQAAFLEQTILSVIGQNYPNLEYIILDGGSTDESVEIIKKYEQYITHWESKKDSGQGSAINEGFSLASGEVLCWLNSDDMYTPGALLKIGRLFQTISEPTIIFGNCLHFHENSPKTRGSDMLTRHKELDLRLCDYIIQPSSFWNSSAWQKTGKIDENLHYIFDWDWFIRARNADVKFLPLKDYLSLYRIHESHKSGSGGNKRAKELADIYKRYTGPKEQKAFLKWNRLRTGSTLFHNMVYVCNKYRISIINRLIHLLFFPNVSYDTYCNIVKMY